jgi:hypothetical protein
VYVLHTYYAPAHSIMTAAVTGLLSTRIPYIFIKLCASACVASHPSLGMVGFTHVALLFVITCSTFQTIGANRLGAKRMLAGSQLLLANEDACGLQAGKGYVRSTRPHTLAEEARQCEELWAIIARELDMPCGERVYLNSCIEQGAFEHPSASGGKLKAADNPINLMALGTVATAILADQGLALNKALLVFLESKLKVSILLREELGHNVIYIPNDLSSLDFVEAHRLQEHGLNLSAFLNSSGINRGVWTNFICNELSIIRLPCKHNGRSMHALIPNIVGAADDEIEYHISVFTDLQQKREHMGATLSAEDIKNLKVCFICHMRLFFEFIFFVWTSGHSTKGGKRFGGLSHFQVCGS